MLKSLKRKLLKLIHACGFEVYRLSARAYPKRRTVPELLDYLILRGLTPATVIDVGVGAGTFDVYEKFPRAKFLLVEPLKEFEQALKGIARKYDAEYVIAAAGARPGSADINIYGTLQHSSMLKLEVERDTKINKIRKVPVITLDEICREKQLRGPYVIKIDVQGEELNVLDGATDILADTKLVILEVPFFQYYGEQPELCEVIAYMKQRGFVVYDILEGRNCPITGMLAWADVGFVKEDSPLRAYLR